MRRPKKRGLGLHVTAMLSVAAALAEGSAEASAEAHLFTYFTGNGESGLHLAWSEDGYTWRSVVGGRSVFTARVGRNA